MNHSFLIIQRIIYVSIRGNSFNIYYCLIKYYCVGFVAGTLINNSTCENCKNVLIADVKRPNVALVLQDADIRKKIINRGGLCRASDFVYVARTHMFYFM